jgi:hypothetical protein
MIFELPTKNCRMPVVSGDFDNVMANEFFHIEEAQVAIKELGKAYKVYMILSITLQTTE